MAISDNGLVFIEENDYWEISLNQACDRSLRKDWKRLFRKLNLLDNELMVEAERLISLLLRCIKRS